VKTLFAAIAGLLCLSAAHADPIMRITAEAFPGEEYFIGLNLGQNHKIESLYYEDRYQPVETDRVKTFSFAQLLKGAVIVQKKKYNLVTLMVTKQAADEITLNLNYLTFAPRNKATEEPVKIRWNEHDKKYDVFREGKKGEEQVQGAYIVTNKVPVIGPVGIKRIEFQ
jgi:hypothetical protein